MDSVPQLEEAILKVLSRTNQPLKARAIAAVLSDQLSKVFHKRDINPTLYRMLSHEQLSRDFEFRWFLTKKNERFHAATAVPDRHLQRGFAGVVGPTTRPTGTAGTPKRANEPPSHTTPPVAGPTETSKLNLGETRDYGRFKVMKETRPHAQNCTWCAKRVPPFTEVLVVRGLNGPARKWPRFCSEDCFQCWESIYWQRAALAHMGLPKQELRLENLRLRAQKRFSGFRKNARWP